MDKLKAMEVFVTTLQCGSISNAAKQLHLPVSSASRQLSWLEAQLGTELIKRSTRAINLTEVGRAYLTQCQQVLEQIRQAEELVSSYQQTPSGILTISCMSHYFDSQVLPHLSEFEALYPEIKLDIDVSDRLTDLSKAEIDIAIRGGYLPDERIHARLLCDNTPHLCATPQYIERYGLPADHTELHTHHLAYYRSPKHILTWGIVREGQWLPLELKPDVVTNSGRYIRELMMAGKVMALLPDWSTQDDRDEGKLIKVDLPAPICLSAERLGLYLLYYTPRYQVPKIRAAVDFFSQKLAVSR
ncbi:LysR family transcriptional regulator [Photobacterium halotolerans]|uniref:LysR family transcriptional regulator n=1 Tax=Photobacterium halotolerans TaxID=265726 RepID=UPI001372C032|nr:LysR family transcriptional regulator [Photobacterium halotolerans]NAX46168.1 LysR family transcriptional regulator [Photobacterium halotolerans]